MRTVAVILGDNDFGSMMYPLMETILIHLKYKKKLNRKHLKYWIYESLRAYYIMYQMAQDEKKIGSENFNSTIGYLQSKLRVLFDEEAEQSILKSDYDHGAWYLEVQSGNIKSY